MKRNLFVRVVSSTVAVLCLSAVALAQTGPTAPPTPPATPPAQAAGILPEQGLEAALKALDPNCRIKPTSGGQGKLYNLSIVRDGWKYDLQIESFKNEIWLNALLGNPITNPQDVPPAVMADLLKANFKVGPTHFALAPLTDNTGYRLNLCRLLDRRMTIESFNGYVSDFLKVVREQHPVWSQVR